MHFPSHAARPTNESVRQSRVQRESDELTKKTSSSFQSAFELGRNLDKEHPANI